MKITNILGEGLLWVDALCIVDNSRSKKGQIQRMGSIYHSSLLTIVPLGAAKASDPLDSSPHASYFSMASSGIHSLRVEKSSHATQSMILRV